MNDAHPPSPPAYVADSDGLRTAMDDIANQLSRVVDGKFDFVVQTEVQDETTDKLVMLVNFVLDAARRAVAEAEERTERLAERNVELEQFAYVASHDLQEPLRMVRSFLQLLERRYQGQLDERADEYIHFAVDGAERMQRLIRDLLTYSRVGQHDLSFESVPLDEALATAVQNLHVAVEESQAVLSHGPLPSVSGDRGQLVQLFQNLLSNAIKFRGEAPPVIHVAAEPGARGWEVAVRDHGIGIGSEHRERIFQIFQRLHGRGEYEGTGIGLAVCKKIVERHGGRIWVEDPEGEGTRFVFTLPDAGSDRARSEA